MDISKIEFRVAGANQDATSTTRCDLSQDPSTCTCASEHCQHTPPTSTPPPQETQECWYRLVWFSIRWLKHEITCLSVEQVDGSNNADNICRSESSSAVISFTCAQRHVHFSASNYDLRRWYIYIYQNNDIPNSKVLCKAKYRNATACGWGGP